MTLHLVTFNFSVVFEDSSLSVIREDIKESRFCKQVFCLERISDYVYCLYETASDVCILRVYEDGSDDIVINEASLLDVGSWTYVKCGSFSSGSVTEKLGAIFFYAFSKNVMFPTWTLSILPDGRLVSSKPTIAQKINSIITD
jgi:hypothetical protein